MESYTTSFRCAVKVVAPEVVEFRFREMLLSFTRRGAVDGPSRRFPMSVKICIVGCGALGSVIAAHLAHLEDVEVYAYDVSQDHVRAIRECGLQISGASDFTVKVHATSDAKEIPACDFGVFATKSLHTRAAVEQTAHIFRTSGAVCSVQNGLGNEEIIAERVRYVIRGATTMAAHMRGPGHAGFEFYSNLWIGPFEPSATPFERVQELADLLNRSVTANRFHIALRKHNPLRFG